MWIPASFPNSRFINEPAMCARTATCTTSSWLWGVRVATISTWTYATRRVLARMFTIALTLGYWRIKPVLSPGPSLSYIAPRVPRCHIPTRPALVPEQKLKNRGISAVVLIAFWLITPLPAKMFSVTNVTARQVSVSAATDVLA